MDRNTTLPVFYAFSKMSLSARRAWIEMLLFPGHKSFDQVALRKESVDRNDNYNLHCVEEVSSLSARRAWIEIPSLEGRKKPKCRRSPQGERG